MKIFREVKEKIQVKNSDKVIKYLREFINEDREHVIILGLNTNLEVIYRDIAHIGGLSVSLVEPRGVFRRAVMMNAASIILVHNHPSGNPTPSPEDLELFNTLDKCGKILEIPITDCLILGDTSYWARRTGEIKEYPEGENDN